IQDIFRSEVCLAKIEVREEVVKIKSSSLLLGAGALAGAFGTLFLLLTVVYALALVLPSWAAALIVGGALAIAASVLLSAGIQRFRAIHTQREGTVESLRGNVEWVKQHTNEQRAK